jgi:hypothetical protein
MSLMSKAQEVGMSPEGLASRLLLVNFAGIHPTSMVSDGVPSPPMMQSCALRANRRSRKYCIVFSPILNLLNLSAKRSRP